MNQSMRRAVLAAWVVGTLVAATGQARAETIVTFSYSGRGGPDDPIISTGSGSFTFADGLTTVGLANLLTFEFTLDETTPNTAQFGLADLTTFSATLGPGPTLTGLALTTSFVQGTNAETWPRQLIVSSLETGDASTRYSFLLESIFLTSGTATVTSVVTTGVPEPPTAHLAIVAALIAAGGWARIRTTLAARLTPAGPPGSPAS